MSALPYIKFFPSDWLSEESLRLVSFQARGLWIDLLCLMAKSERRGYLTVNGGVNPTLAQVGKLVGSNEAEITPLLDELKRAGTCSIEPGTGVLFSRRLVRDTSLYEQAVNYGLKGGNPRLKKPTKKHTVNPTLNPNEQPSLGSGILGSGNGSTSLKSEIDAIYAAYPRKEAPAAAKKAIAKALGTKSPADLLAATQAYANAVKTWPEADRRFVPHPATWFNRGSYDDDPATWKRGKDDSEVAKTLNYSY